MGCSSTKTILLLCPEDFNLTHHFNSFYRFGSNANSFIFWLIAWLLDWFCTPSVTQATSSIMIDFFISNNIIVTITPWIARIILRFLPCWRTMPLNTYIVVWIIKTSFWNYSANEITRCFAGNYLRWHHIGAKKTKVHICNLIRNESCFTVSGICCDFPEVRVAPCAECAP